MALDEKVKESIIEAVAKNHQSESVAKKIIKLLEGLSNGEANINDRDDMKTYLKLILQATEINH